MGLLILKPFVNSEADRQHRRLSYEDRDKWNVLPTHALVKITIEASNKIAQLLQGGTHKTIKKVA